MFHWFNYLLIAVERIRLHWILVFWTLVGLTTAATLSMSLLLYVDAVNTDVLRQELDAEPYAFRLRYVGAWEGNIEQADVEYTTASIDANLIEVLDLPVSQDMRYVSVGRWTARTEQSNLGTFIVAGLDGFTDKVELVQGEWYTGAETAEGVYPVMISENYMFTTGVQVGDELTVNRAGGQTLTIEVVGLWRSIIEDDTSWVLPARFFDEVLLLPMDILWEITATQENPIEEVDWQVIFDGSAVRANDVAQLAPAISEAERELGQSLPGLRMDVSPLENMESFNAEVEQLTHQLVIVILPVAGLILYFIVMIAGMLVNRQQNADLLLNSRGMSRLKLLQVHSLIWGLCGSISFGIALALAPPLVQFIGQTTTFMQFDNTASHLQIKFNTDVLAAGLGTALLAASSGLFIAWGTTRQTMLGFKRGRARRNQAWWQRFYLDVILLVPAGYVFYTLQAEDGITASATEPFADPLVFLAPTLFALGATLLFLRLLPIVLGFCAGLLNYTNDLPLLMAFRELRRSMWRYRSTLLMMGFTLSLIGFTASMASTLDQSLKDVIEYNTGADSVLIVAADAQTSTSTDAAGSTSVTVEGYNTLPISQLDNIEGIELASRIGEYEAELVLPTSRVQGTFIGVDRWALPSIAYFREDYADSSLAELMNLLANNRTGVILNVQIAREYNLHIGQQITLNVRALNSVYPTTVTILGVVDYFPTQDPREGFFVLGNIEPLFELIGTELPHNIWLNLEDAADVSQVQTDVRGLGYPILEWVNPQEELFIAQTESSRRGILGFLSVGFVSAIFLTLVGSIMQTIASFRAQTLQLGTLRAMGMRQTSVSTYLISSQGMAVMSGVLSGTGIGVLTTILFLPLLDFSGGLPPYLVRVAWDDIVQVYVVFAALLLSITFGTALLLNRQQLSTLVKLGDS